MPETEKNVILGQQKRSKQSEFYEFELQAANQRLADTDARLQAANQKEKNVDEALNQQHALKGLLNELLDAENGVSATPIDKWKMKASTITAVLENPLARPKNPETVQLLQNIEASLKK
jgi:FMN-dependent NADH-azoreductase